MGGVGKTQLVLEYAYRHAHEFDLVWWLHAEEPTTLQEDFAALPHRLELPEAQEQELALVGNAVRQELSRRERWLLVFDNATAPQELVPFLPEGKGQILITSRQPGLAICRGWLDLRPLTRSASVSLAARSDRAGRPQRPPTPWRRSWAICRSRWIRRPRT